MLSAYSKVSAQDEECRLHVLTILIDERMKLFAYRVREHGRSVTRSGGVTIRGSLREHGADLHHRVRLERQLGKAMQVTNADEERCTLHRGRGQVLVL